MKTPLLFTVAIPFVYYMMNHFNNYKIDFMTGVFLWIMLCILFIEAVISRRQIVLITNELTNAIKSSDIAEYRFENKTLDIAFVKYKAACRNANNEAVFVAPDIADYIDEELVAEKTRRDVTAQIGSVMTALGILGTFVGLTMSLENFDTSMAIESTSTLLGGIKTAFYTSIFGILASLVYNHFYEVDIENNRKAINDFCEAIYNRVLPTKKESVYRQLLQYNKQQTESLNKLAGAIAENMAPEFAKAIKKSVMPTMEKLNNSIDSYIMRAVETQSETLGKIVDNFMHELNGALDDQFSNLSHSINNMCNYQNDSVDKLKSILGSIDTISRDLVQLNIDMSSAETNRQKTIEETLNMIERAKRFTDAFNEYAATVHQWTENMKNASDMNIDYMKSVKIYSDRIEKDKSELIDELNKYLQDSQNYRNNINSIMEMQNKRSDQLSSFIDSALQKIEKQNNDMENRYKRNFDKIEETIDGALSANTKLCEDTKKMSTLISNLEDIMIDVSDRDTKISDGLNLTLKEIKAFQQNCADIAANMKNDHNVVIATIKQSNEAIITDIKMSLKRIRESIEKSSESMKRGNMSK